MLVVCQLQRRCTVEGRQHLEVRLLEILGQQLKQGRIVIDQQDLATSFGHSQTEVESSSAAGRRIRSAAHCPLRSSNRRERYKPNP